MEGGGRMSGLASQQDGGQFEDALRRLHALEKKLTDQVQVDITELRNKWVQPRVERVTNNTFKLWQVRENLKLSKSLYVEEDRLLGEFKKVKDALISASMDDEYFEATKDTCVFLGGKLTEVRNQQLLCYSGSRDLETSINKDIMTIRFEEKDFADLDLNQVRAQTPLRELGETPLDRHRSKSREPSPFQMHPLRLSSGTTTPGSYSTSDPHAYFSRPGSSQSLYGGRGPTDKGLDEFRSKLEAAQAKDDSPPKGRKPGGPNQGMVLRDASGKMIKDDLDPFHVERPGSALSDMSIQLPGETSRPASRASQQVGMLGDELSHSLLDISQHPSFNGSNKSPAPEYGKNLLDDLDVEINLGEEAATKREEEEASSARNAEKAAEKIRADAKANHEAKEKERKIAEAAQKKADTEAKAEKLKIEKEVEAKEREERKKADDKKMADMAEKRKIAKEQEAEKEAIKKEEEAKKKEEDKKKKLEAKQKKEAEEQKKEEEKQAKEEEKKVKAEEKKRKMEETKQKKLMEAEEKKRAEEERALEAENKAMVDALKQETQKAEDLKIEMQKAKEENRTPQLISKEEAKRVEASKKQMITEQKSLKKDVADLETELGLEATIPKETSSKAGEKKPEEEAPKRPLSRTGKKDTAPQEEAKAAEPKRPTSRAGKKETEPVEEAPKRPTSRTGKKEPEAAGKTAPAGSVKSAEPKSVAVEASDADDEGEIIVEKPRSKSRSASRTRTAIAVEEEEESEREEQPRKPTKPVSRNTSKAAAKEDPAATKDAKTSKPVSRSNSKAGAKDEAAATKKKEDAGAAFVDNLRQRSSSRGRPETEEQEVSEQAPMLVPPKPASRTSSTGGRKVSESERKISESETAPQAGSQKNSRTGSPVGILKGGKRSRDASKDRAKIEAANEEPLPGKPVSRSASLKKSLSFSKKTQSYEDDMNKPGEPIQSAKDIFAAIADTTLESGTKSRSDSKERPGSRGSGSGFPQTEPREMPMSAYDDEDELMIVLDDAEMEKLMGQEELMKSRSQSHERPGSRGSQSSQASSRQGAKGDFKSRSASNVPELESVEVPESLKSMIEDLRRMEAEEDEEELALPGSRPRSGAAREPKEEFPRPMSSQARPVSSAGSTGFSHLDEFERKLAEMEDEQLEHEVVDEAGRMSRSAHGEWDLSEGKRESFHEVAQDFKDTFAMNITKLAQERGEAIYATVQKKRKQSEGTSRTDDGFYINNEEELGSVDHSMIHDMEYTEDDVQSEYIFDEITGQSIRRSKKVSFAAAEERWEIQRETQVSGLGRMKELFTLSAPKPMRPLPGKEPKAGSEEPRSDSIFRRSSSKEPSPSPSNFMHAMTGGLVGSASPSVSRSGSVTNLFGSLLRKGRKGSRSGSQQGSRDSSGDRGSDMGDLEDGRGSSMSYASDAGSDNSIVMKIKNMRKKKPKVQPQDFDQLFARGLALSAQLESEQNKDPFGPKAVDVGRQLMEVGAATAAAGGDTAAISSALSDGVSGVTGARIGYQEKVNAYLDDQAQTPGAPINMVDGQQERGRRRHRKEPKTKAEAPLVALEAAAAARSRSDEKRKTSREYTKPEDIMLSPQPRRNLFTGEVLAPGSPDALFLKKVTEFVKQQETASNQNLLLSSGSLPGMRPPPSPIPSDLLGALAPPQAPRLAPSPGKAFLESTTGFDVFGPSIDRDNPQPVQENKDGAMSNEAYPPSSLTMTKFTAAAKDAVIKLTSPPPTSAVAQPQRLTVAQLPPGMDEPADKGIPTQLMPDKLMANEEFYEKLRTGLKTALTPERGFDSTQEDPGSYQKYSHHLGRAEFGTLKKPSAATSRDTSSDKLNQGRMPSRNTSSDKINIAGSRKVSRQSSGTNLHRDMRSDSRTSDYSIALPDLEVDPDAVMEMERDVVGSPVLRTMSDNVNDPPPVSRPTVASQDVLVRKEEVLRDMELHREKIQEAKAWIQNGLMTVVGVGVMAYLQTLEQMGGAT